jgi:hypothetical protein
MKPASPKKFQMDPDFRRDPKTNRYCARCQRDLAPNKVAIPVTVNWDNWEVTLDPEGKDLLGVDCARAIGIKVRGKNGEAA